MTRAIVIILIATALGAAAGLTIYAAWPKTPPGQNCQLLRWESRQLWPDGGGPPLPAGC